MTFPWHCCRRLQEPHAVAWLQCWSDSTNPRFLVESDPRCTQNPEDLPGPSSTSSLLPPTSATSCASSLQLDTAYALQRTGCLLYSSLELHVTVRLDIFGAEAASDKLALRTHLISKRVASKCLHTQSAGLCEQLHASAAAALSGS